jgi:hypothetical protein
MRCVPQFRTTSNFELHGKILFSFFKFRPKKVDRFFSGFLFFIFSSYFYFQKTRLTFLVIFARFVFEKMMKNRRIATSLRSNDHNRREPVTKFIFVAFHSGEHGMFSHE